MNPSDSDVQLYASLQAQLDAYAAFFRRRADIEYDYADALKKLHFKQLELDRRMEEEDRSAGATSFRKAYLDIRNNLLEEAQAHGIFAERTRKITTVLADEKEKKDRMRRRIKEDVRTTITEHSEYKSTVTRLRRTYESKVDEVLANEEANSHSEADWSESESTGGPGHSRERRNSSPYRGVGGGGGGGGGAGGGGTSPPFQPSHYPHPSISPPPTVQVFVSGATSTSHTASSAYRDAPAAKPNNVFEQIAKRDWGGDKSRVNSIVRAVGNLGKGNEGTGAGAVGQGGGKKLGRSKVGTAGKLKREAEQADRDYRDGIFRLETLRLQRERVSRSASGSLVEFAHELSALMRRTFGEHMSDLDRMSQKEILTAQRVIPSLHIINPDQDAQTFAKRFREPEVHEPPVYYQNAFVGECRTLLFGVSLTDYLSTHPNQLVPLIVKMCVAQIEATGMATEGIYRIPGKLATVQQLVHAVEKDEIAFSFDSRVDPAAVAGVLKLYLRQLPQPLFPYPTPDRLSLSHAYSQDPGSQLASLARRLKRLSPPQQATLKALCLHLARVAERSDTNKMTPTNLGLVFTPVVFGEDETVTLESAMHSSEDIIMELLIVHHAALFVGLPVPVEPVVPAARPVSVGVGWPSRPSSAMGPAPPSIETATRASAPSFSPSQPRSSSPSPTELSKPVPAAPRTGDPDSSSVRHPRDPPFTASTEHLTDEDLGSPTPPLSAAGGRQIPPPAEGANARRRQGSSRSSSGATHSNSLPPGWDGSASSPPISTPSQPSSPSHHQPA